MEEVVLERVRGNPRGGESKSWRNPDRERLRADCDMYLGAAIEEGMTMDEVLAVLRDAGYYDCIGQTPASAAIQLLSADHEVRDREFILRYKRVLNF